MLAAGDEMGRTQRGNNNAYCQDNDISWLDWDLSPRQQDLLAFTRYALGLFTSQPVLKRRFFLRGRNLNGGERKDVAWFDPGGEEMAGDAWQAPTARTLAFRLDGTQIQEHDAQGDRIVGDTLYIMFSAQPEAVLFVFPDERSTERWERLLDTSRDDWAAREVVSARGYLLAPRAVAAFRLVPAPPDAGRMAPSDG